MRRRLDGVDAAGDRHVEVHFELLASFSSVTLETKLFDDTTVPVVSSELVFKSRSILPP